MVNNMAMREIPVKPDALRALLGLENEKYIGIHQVCFDSIRGVFWFDVIVEDR